MAEIEINGQKIEAKPGSMVIEAADNLGIQIPRFCYHRKLPIAANCRMCLVEVEKSPKPLPACATPVTAGMKIWTKTPKVIEAQKSVMEFLLINHPLDCPICDQGGECELQDVSLEYGEDVSHFREAKRVVVDQDLGPLIASDMTRCIQCTRCVRFGSEIAGYRELGATGRGEHLEISTFIQHNIESEVSGNVIDICPVGALTSKPYRFTARGWELNQTASVSPHDCVGSNLFIHTRQNEVMRVVPRENEALNEVWLSDRDRFSYEALAHKERLTMPKIKHNGIWQEVTWEKALTTVLKGLETVKQQAGVKNIGVLASPNLSLEEFYISQKFFRALGIENLDHRLREVDFRDQKDAPIFPYLGLSLAALENQKVLFLVGANIHKEQPILGLKCRKMALLGAKILALNTRHCAYHFEVYKRKVVSKGDLVFGLAGIAKALCRLNIDNIPEGAEQWLRDIEPSTQDLEMAKILSEGQVSILMGFEASSHPEASRIRSLCTLMALLSGATFGTLTEGANAAGGWLSGFVPHRLAGGQAIEASYSISEMFDKKLKAYCLLGAEPDMDCIESGKASEALNHADFVCAMSAYESDFLNSVANVVLPIAPFTENEGTFVNVEGKWQSVRAMIKPIHQSRPLWKVMRVLGNLAQLPQFEYQNIEEILQELHMQVSENDPVNLWPWRCPSDLKTYVEETGIMRIGAVPLYAADGLVRRAPALQKMKDAGRPHLALNATLAMRLHLHEGQNARVVYKDAQCMLVTVIDETIPDDTVFIPLSLKKTVYLGRPYCMVNIYAE
jgi:NADH-quinone oxidoreductase subunit G